MTFVIENMSYVIGGFLAFLVILYFAIDYQIKTTLVNELKKIGEKKSKMQKRKNQEFQNKMKSEQAKRQYEVDTYQDPVSSQNDNYDE